MNIYCWNGEMLNGEIYGSASKIYWLGMCVSTSFSFLSTPELYIYERAIQVIAL